MKIERIDENSISCTLSSFDLSVRNMDIRELAYGSEKARKLFDEMMTKAKSEVGFKVDNSPIMIEAIPMSSDSIKLIISKVMDPGELDARFSRFTKGSQDARNSDDAWLQKLTSAFLEGAEDFVKKFTPSSPAGAKKALPPKQDLSTNPRSQKPGLTSSVSKLASKPGQVSRAFAFDDIDEVLGAAKAVSLFGGDSVLYKNPDTGVYVLILKGKSISDEDFAGTCNLLAEYGRMIKLSPHTEAYFDEHYIPIVKKYAICKLAKI